MSDYQPPLDDMRFVLSELAGLDELLALPRFADFDRDTVDQVLEEAGRFAAEVMAPLNAAGDRAGCSVQDRAVVVADGFADAYAQFVAGGWQALAANPEFGGMGMPELVGATANEMWQSANMSLALCPLLTAGAIVALEAHGDDRLRSRYLPRLVSGEWSGTMNLTEPQAGSDLAALNCRAVPEGDHFLVTGTKIFITWGDHPMAENILHLVLARLPDAADGVRGISLFAVPKYLLNDDDTCGARNDVFPVSVEHKLGIHASPTCVMSFGENGGAIGYLVGEANQGLRCMFTMMNHARLNVATQGVSVSERAYQLARRHAKERVQGTVPGRQGRVTIIHHPDVRRMLLLMKAHIEAMRAGAYWTAAQVDLEQHATTAEARETASGLFGLLTPVVKGWLTEVAQEVASLGIQVHGGMGFVEETGAAQHLRDARILPIYEGTTGIQANDLVGRKLLGDEGRMARRLTAMMRRTADELGGVADYRPLADSLAAAVSRVERGVTWLLDNAGADPAAAGCAAVNLLMLIGNVFGGWHMARAVQRLAGRDDRFAQSRRLTAEFYFRHILPRSEAYLQAAIAGTGAVMRLDEDMF